MFGCKADVILDKKENQASNYCHYCFIFRCLFIDDVFDSTVICIKQYVGIYVLMTKHANQNINRIQFKYRDMKLGPFLWIATLNPLCFIAPTKPLL